MRKSASRGSYVSAQVAGGVPLLMQSPGLAMAALGDDTRPDPLDHGNRSRYTSRLPSPARSDDMRIAVPSGVKRGVM